MDYCSAGVDLSKGDLLVARIKSMMGASGARIGHFGGAIPIDTAGRPHPLLVSSIDGVGTKTKIAQALGRYGTIGQDLVHHCINDIACCGAEPIAFLDYIAMANMDVDVAAEVIGGCVKACDNWGVALAGGENAEMPGVYQPGELDLVGCIYGIVDESEYLDGRSIVKGDLLLGFSSNGLHTNGYSLARKVTEAAGGFDFVPYGWDHSLGEGLLLIHRCYLPEIRWLKAHTRLKGLAHITGGGLVGNVPRIIPKGLRLKFNWGCWPMPRIFKFLQEKGNIPEDVMRSAFNLGIGLVAVMDPSTAQQALSNYPKKMLKPMVIGEVLG